MSPSFRYMANYTMCASIAETVVSATGNTIKVPKAYTSKRLEHLLHNMLVLLI